MDFFLDDDDQEVPDPNLLGGDQGVGGGGDDQVVPDLDLLGGDQGVGGGGGQGGEGGGGQGGEGGGGQGGEGGGGQGGGDGGGQGGEGGGQGGGGGGGQGGGDGVDHADLVERIEQIVQALERATFYIVTAQQWITNGVQMMGDLPEQVVRPRRALQAIQDGQFRIQLSLGQIQQAIDAIVPMFQLPVIEPFPEVIDMVAGVHDVINHVLVGLHGNLLVLAKAQVYPEAQARIQIGLSFLHIALTDCQDAFTIFEFLHDGHDWDWGEADVQQQA